MVEQSSGLEESGVDEGSDTSNPDSQIVIGKAELLDSIQKIVAYSADYDLLLESITDGDDWRERATALFIAHRARMDEGNAPLDKIGLILSLVRYLLQRVGQESFRFKMTSRVGHFSEHENADLLNLSNSLREWSLPVSLMVADIIALETTAQPDQQEKLRVLLTSITSFFKALVRQDWDDVTLLMSHMNLVTSTRERHELVRSIAKLAREIYDSLNEFSDEIALDNLSSTTEEIPDALVKLRTVIARLEDAANTNLDLLEKLTAAGTENDKWIDECAGVARDCEEELNRLREQHPDLEDKWRVVGDLMRDQVRAKLDRLAEQSNKNGEVLMTMMANQGFQDLTGQTLERVINFIEVLQNQLVELLKRHTGDDGMAAKPAPDVSEQEAEAPAEGRQSQEQVDQLLTDLGF